MRYGCTDFNKTAHKLTYNNPLSVFGSIFSAYMPYSFIPFSDICLRASAAEKAKAVYMAQSLHLSNQTDTDSLSKISMNKQSAARAALPSMFFLKANWYEFFQKTQFPNHCIYTTTQRSSVPMPAEILEMHEPDSAGKKDGIVAYPSKASAHFFRFAGF